MTQQEYLNSKYSYDKNTGNIILKESRNTKSIGKIMGKPWIPYSNKIQRGGGPYIRFSLHNGKRTNSVAKDLGLPANGFAHRIIWIMIYGSIPENHQIDHVDHDGTNNKFSNLRCVTAQENQRNRKQNKNNTSGYIGIVKRENKYEASTKSEGEYVYIGRYDTIPEAIAARDAFYKSKNFHENHGKSGK